MGYFKSFIDKTTYVKTANWSIKFFIDLINDMKNSNLSIETSIDVGT